MSPPTPPASLKSASDLPRPDPEIMRLAGRFGWNARPQNKQRGPARAPKRPASPANPTPKKPPVLLSSSDSDSDRDMEYVNEEFSDADSSPDESRIAEQETNKEDDFTLVVNKRKKNRRSFKPRPHPAILVQRKPPTPRTVAGSTILFRPTEEGNLHKVSKLLLAKDLQIFLPRPTAVRNIRRGGLAVDFPNSNPPPNALGPLTLAGVPVMGELPRPRQGSRGTIRGTFTAAEELQELYSLHEENPDLFSATRIGVSNVWTLHFNTPKLPDNVVIFYNVHRIAPYFSSPVRCYNCQRFNHIAADCRSEAICSKCGVRGHVYSTCSSENTRCVNCGGLHSASSKQCPHRIYELRVRKEEANSGLSREEARITVAKSYADAAKKKAPTAKPKGLPPSRGGQVTWARSPAPTHPRQRLPGITRLSAVTSRQTETSGAGATHSTRRKEALLAALQALQSAADSTWDDEESLMSLLKSALFPTPANHHEGKPSYADEPGSKLQAPEPEKRTANSASNTTRREQWAVYSQKAGFPGRAEDSSPAN